MRSNHLTPAQLQTMGSPEIPNQGFGYGLGVGVMIDRGLNGSMRSTGAFGWGGAAGTECVIDPQEDLIILTMTQRLAAPRNHNTLLQNLVYQAIE
jgi:CubicO group peptidase (beta-lactamase class C family)